MTEDITAEPASTASKENEAIKPENPQANAAPLETEGAKPEAEPTPPPPPEPLTPERARAENWRNDLFIMGAVLVTAFLLGSVKITNTDFWLNLKSGWQIDQQGIPQSDPFAYSTEGQKWVPSSWLYDWGLYRLELIESRMQVNRLVDDYRRLLAHSQEPQFDAQGREVGKKLSDDKVQELDAAFANLADSAKTADTYQMRVAAERTAEMVRSAGLAQSQLLYPALAAYSLPWGEALIHFGSAVALKALLLAALAAVFLCIRHPGPTSWWTAVVTVLAFVGMSDRFLLTPSVFSLFGVGVVLWIVHAYASGRTWAAWLFIPLELLWVNMDAGFALGFVLIAMVLVCQIVGGAMRRSIEVTEPRPATLAGAFALALVATLINRNGLGAWLVPYEWTAFMIGRTSYVAAMAASLFGVSAPWVAEAIEQGAKIQSLAPDLNVPISRGYARLFAGWIIPPIVGVLVILAAFVSFGLNRRRFRVSRFLILLFGVGMFLFAVRYVGFAVLAAGFVLALNGQEWYLDRYGVETRITRGWWLWSQAGRAVTVLGIVAIAITAILGWLGTASEFGYGVQWVRFDFMPGKLLREANLKGRVLNTVPVQGNLLIWSNYPGYQVYVDGRELLHRSHLQEFEEVKKALRDDDADVLGSVLDKYGVSHVVLNITSLGDNVVFSKTMARMSRDTKWELLQVSSNSAVFGRVDFPEGHELASDGGWFQKNSFDPARAVFTGKADPLPEPPGPVTPPSLIDRIWRRRRVLIPQAIAADHYLTSVMPKIPTTQEEAAKMGPVFVVPVSNCFLAIQEVRRGLAKDPRVSPAAYSVLSKAYFYLYNTELMLAPASEIHDMRALQLLTALNQWVAANPKDAIAQLHLVLRFRKIGYFDLADRHMDKLLELWPDDARLEEFFFDGGQRISLDKEMLLEESRRIKDELDRVDYDMEQLSEQLANPLTKANYLGMRGCPARAIETLIEASAFGVGMDLSPQLARLYLRIGQPGDTERGADQQMVNMQGSGGMRAGEKEELWALVKLMQGDYDRARSYLEAAIADTRINLAKEALLALTTDLRTGGIMHMAFGPVDMVEDIDRLIRMEHHLGLIHVEAGEPDEAAKHFKQALSLRDDNPFRPVLGFYLEKITGEKLEPLPEPAQEQADQPKEGADKPEAKTPETPPKPGNH